MLHTDSFATIMVLDVAGTMYLKRLFKMNSEDVPQACTLYWGQKMALKLHFLLASSLEKVTENC